MIRLQVEKIHELQTVLKGEMVKKFVTYIYNQ